MRVRPVGVAAGIGGACRSLIAAGHATTGVEQQLHGFCRAVRGDHTIRIHIEFNGVGRGRSGKGNNRTAIMQTDTRRG